MSMTKMKTVERRRKRAQKTYGKLYANKQHFTVAPNCAKQNGGRPIDISVCIIADMRGYAPCKNCFNRLKEV